MSRARNLIAAVALGLAGIPAAQSLEPLPIPPAPPVDPSALIYYDLPDVRDSYGVLCERGGLSFGLGGGLLYLDPDAAQVKGVTAPDGFAVPDRYQAARCSPDGGRTWGNVFLDFYAPNNGRSSGVDTGLEPVIFGDDANGQDVDEQQAADFATLVSALQDAFLPDAARARQTLGDAQSLPSLPSPLYVIDVRYRGALGAYSTLTVPGVLGAPSLVTIFNYYANAPETLVVSIGPSQTQAANGAVTSSGYALKIQRPTPPAGACYRLEADVKVSLRIANPLDPGYPNSTGGTFELGYATIGVPGAGRAPSIFEVKYESSAASASPAKDDFFIEVTPLASCSQAAPLAVVGRFSDAGNPQNGADDVDLALDVQMPVMSRWTLSRHADPAGKLTLTSSAGNPITRISLQGVNKGKTMAASLAGLPQSLTVCADQGNTCNQGWRLDRRSDISFRIAARDQAGLPSPVSVRYSQSDANDSTDFSLTLSDLAIDSHAGRIKWYDITPFGSASNYPMWFYFDTGGRPLGGRYTRVNGGHALAIDMPGVTAWNREYVLDKKLTGLRLTRWGYMACSGFSLSTDLIAGPLVQWIVGAALCS